MAAAGAGEGLELILFRGVRAALWAKLAAREVRLSPDLGALFSHAGGPGKADFVGVGRASGMTLDITTPGQVASHLARPCGLGMSIVTFQRPPWFTTF
jgi:hypothetical protein